MSSFPFHTRITQLHNHLTVSHRQKPHFYCSFSTYARKYISFLLYGFSLRVEETHKKQYLILYTVYNMQIIQMH